MSPNDVNIIIIIMMMMMMMMMMMINNFFFVGIIQHFNANYKPSKMKVLKDTFRQGFKFPIYRSEFKKKTSAYAHTSTHAYIDYRHNYIIIYERIHTHID